MATTVAPNIRDPNLRLSGKTPDIEIGLQKPSPLSREHVLNNSAIKTNEEQLSNDTQYGNLIILLVVLTIVVLIIIIIWLFTNKPPASDTELKNQLMPGAMPHPNNNMGAVRTARRPKQPEQKIPEQIQQQMEQRMQQPVNRQPQQNQQPVNKQQRPPQQPQQPQQPSLQSIPEDDENYEDVIKEIEDANAELEQEDFQDTSDDADETLSPEDQAVLETYTSL